MLSQQKDIPGSKMNKIITILNSYTCI
jgi:hypothetical protein